MNTALNLIDLAEPAGRSPSLMRLLAPGPRFSICTRGCDDRRDVEQYVADQFARSYGAQISDFLPFLVTMKCAGGLSAVAGVRPATAQPLFLEQYLDRPIDRLIAQHTKSPVLRESIVEIGNLAATHRGASQVLFLLLAAMLHEAGFSWVACTATPRVRTSLERLGFSPLSVGCADPSLLSGDPSAWGSYYRSRPSVCVGHVPSAIAALEQRKLVAAALSMLRPRAAVLAGLLSDRS